MAEQAQAPDLNRVIAALRAAASGTGDHLSLPDWGDEDWRRLLAAGTFRRVPAGEALIRRGAQDRTLFLVLNGELEVMAHAGDGMSLGRLARIGPGSVVGEQSFFDGEPRSAGAWAVRDCELAAITFVQFAAFAETNAGPARDFLFALGRILATRLRRTTAKVVA